MNNENKYRENKWGKWGKYLADDENTYYHLVDNGIDLYCAAGTQHWCQAMPPDGSEIRES